MSKNNVLSLIEASLPTLTGVNLTIATYILGHRDEVVDMSTEELARACGVGEATVIRFARMMGADGYRDFKLSLSASNAVRSAFGTELSDFNTDDSVERISDKLAAYMVTSIESTNNILDRRELERAVNMIDDAYKSGHRVYLAGMGATGSVVRAFAVKLMRLCVPTVYYEDFHLQLESFLGIEPEDVLVCFSVLGRSVENEQLVAIARERGCNVIVVTQHNAGSLAGNATCVLHTSCVESEMRLASQTGLIVQMFVSDVLFTALAMRHIEPIQNAVRTSRQKFIELGHYTS